MDRILESTVHRAASGTSVVIYLPGLRRRRRSPGQDAGHADASSRDHTRGRRTVRPWDKPERDEDPTICKRSAAKLADNEVDMEHTRGATHPTKESAILKSDVESKLSEFSWNLLVVTSGVHASRLRRRCALTTFSSFLSSGAALRLEAPRRLLKNS